MNIDEKLIAFTCSYMIYHMLSIADIKIVGIWRSIGDEINLTSN